MLLTDIANKAIEPLKWLLIIAIAYTLATTVLSFVAGPTIEVRPPSESRQNQAQNTRAPGNVNWILTKHLFGEAGAAPEVAAATEVNNVTQLPLELQSVFVAEMQEESAAIIAQRGKPGKLFSIGDKLQGNATLVEVLTDRVILRRAGVREALLFPETQAQFVPDTLEDESPQTTQTTNSVQRRNQSTPTQSNDAKTAAQEAEVNGQIDEYLDKIATDAEGTLQELGIETVDTDASGGYRIGNEAAQNPFLRNTGLQSGDVILSVNGRPVGNVQQDRLELQNILAQGSARIEVLRGERRFFITASLN